MTAWMLLLLRVWLGLLFMAHGAEKAFGWGGGQGFAHWQSTVARTGFAPVRTYATLAVAVEIGGGLLLAVGLVTPAAAAALAVILVLAIVRVHARRGLWNQKGGMEFQITVLIALAVVGICGPGRAAVDGLLGFPTGSNAAVFALGLLIGLAVAASGVRARPNPTDVSS